MSEEFFSRAEFESRLANLRGIMAERGLDACIISGPENIFYLIGLDHWGYFAPHLLIVPAKGEMTLITRAMEKVTIAHQVRNARFQGHSDSETAADKAIHVLSDLGLGSGLIGLEGWSAGLPHALAETLKRGLRQARWTEISGWVDDLRLVKSPAEQAYMRDAARVTDATAAAAIEAIRDGASEREIAAEAHRAMIAAGGTYPGFGPFIRSSARLGEEHTSWSGARIAAGDSIFLELSGCVRRYHAPLGRLIHVGRVPDGTREIAAICEDAFHAVLDALRPGALARDVYGAWQKTVDAAGLSHYRRHHCGYLVGIGVPPSWTGGNKVTGLRSDSDLEIKSGMTFHILSWLMGTGRGDFFISNTVLLGPDGPEVLTRTPAGVVVR